MKKLKIGMLLFPDLTLLDFVGPYDVFVRAECFEVYTVALNAGELMVEGGLVLRAEYDFESCPLVDILFVPGGKGVTPLLKDESHLNFLKKQGANAQYITSVCTGALLLASAGLLMGYQATTHWRSLELLAMFGIEVINKRVVIDRNRITGGGVTAGIDFGLVLTALIAGEEQAKIVQLFLEYDPQPPFQSGSTKTAEPSVLAKTMELTNPQFEIRKNIINELL